MKTIILAAVLCTFQFHHLQAQESPEVLVGSWKLDLTPEDLSDANFAMMKVKEVKNGKITGIFYRPGVKIQNGEINTQTGRVYGSLMSKDNSGSYNTAFYYQDGKLYGSTHAVERGFLSVWVAIRED